MESFLQKHNNEAIMRGTPCQMSAKPVCNLTGIFRLKLHGADGKFVSKDILGQM
jgi:hypothetical protein